MHIPPAFMVRSTFAPEEYALYISSRKLEEENQTMPPPPSQETDTATVNGPSMSPSSFSYVVMSYPSTLLNEDLTMNALASLVGESDAMAIRSKSLNYNYLTIRDSTASLLKVAMIGVFPLLYLGIGMGVILRRRRMQSETV